MGSEWVQKKRFNLNIVKLGDLDFKKIRFFQALPYAITEVLKYPIVKKLNILIYF